MSITKNYLKTRPVCKVRFRLEPEDISGAEQAHIVGSFNDWSENSHPMKKNKNGSFSLEVELPKDEEVSFRYLLSDGTWLNEPQATEHRYCEYACAHNSILKL